jgi:hypothetical protein
MTNSEKDLSISSSGNLRVIETTDPEFVVTLSSRYQNVVVFNEVLSWWTGLMNKGNVFCSKYCSNAPSSWISETRTLKRRIKKVKV